MVIAYHLIATAYGWWLPNDPRGSMSKSIATDVLAELGALHYGRKKAQPASREIRAFYERAQEKLKHELLIFSPEDVQLLAHAFADVVTKKGYTCYAFAIMPDHIHACIRKHRDIAEDMIGNLQQASRLTLINAGTRPAGHPVWGGPGWKVFLNSVDDVQRTIRYVHGNPRKARLPDQHWPFVARYDNWPHRNPDAPSRSMVVMPRSHR